MKLRINLNFGKWENPNSRLKLGLNGLSQQHVGVFTISKCEKAINVEGRSPKTFIAFQCFDTVMKHAERYPFDINKRLFSAIHDVILYDVIWAERGVRLGVIISGLWQMFRTFVLRCDWSILRILKSTKKHERQSERVTLVSIYNNIFRPYHN